MATDKTPATSDLQPTREALALVEQIRSIIDYGWESNRHRLSPKKAALLIDRFAAQHSTAALVSGDARERAQKIVTDWLMRHGIILHDGVADELDNAFADALTAERAEGRRVALEAAMDRLTRIHIDEAPAGTTPAQAANWAMDIARDEIRALADTLGEVEVG